MKRIVLAVLVLSVMIGLLCAYRNGEQSDNGALRFHGNVETRTVTLGFRFTGQIVRMAKDEGERVEHNETLVWLDDTTLYQTFLQTRAQLVAEEAKLRKLQNGYRREEVDEASAALDEARASFLKAEDSYKREENLVKNRATSEEKFVNAKLEFARTEAAVHRAEALYTLRKNGYRKEDIKAQKAVVESLKASVEKTGKDLEDTCLRTPVDGVILSRFKEPGSVVNPGERVLEIAKSNEFWVRAYMDEPYLGQVNEGDAVLVHTDLDKRYEGRVGFVSPIAEFTPKNVETRELRSDLVYRFRVLIAKPDAFIRQGMPVTVEIVR